MVTCLEYLCQERYLTERYDQMMNTWVKKIERLENNAKRRYATMSKLLFGMFHSSKSLHCDPLMLKVVLLWKAL